MVLRKRLQKPPEDHGRKGIPVSLRVPPEIKAKLDAAAAAGGRTLTQEIVARLEGSFAVAALQDTAATLQDSIQRLAYVSAAAYVALDEAGLDVSKAKPPSFEISYKAKEPKK